MTREERKMEVGKGRWGVVVVVPMASGLSTTMHQAV